MEDREARIMRVSGEHGRGENYTLHRLVQVCDCIPYLRVCNGLHIHVCWYECECMFICIRALRLQLVASVSSTMGLCFLFSALLHINTVLYFI